MKFSLVMALFCLAAGQLGTAQAAYVSTYDYGTTSGHLATSSGSGLAGADYLSIKAPDVSSFSDTFTLSGGITAATLSVSHQGNLAFLNPVTGQGEMWRVKVNGNMVGDLSNSFYNWDTNTPITGWVTDIIQLSPSAVAAINNSGAPIKYAFVSFTDELSKSSSSDFKLNSLTLNATTVATPLPAAIFLFAPGLAGVFAVRKRCQIV